MVFLVDNAANIQTTAWTKMPTVRRFLIPERVGVAELRSLNIEGTQYFVSVLVANFSDYQPLCRPTYELDAMGALRDKLGAFEEIEDLGDYILWKVRDDEENTGVALTSWYPRFSEPIPAKEVRVGTKVTGGARAFFDYYLGFPATRNGVLFRDERLIDPEKLLKVTCEKFGIPLSILSSPSRSRFVTDVRFIAAHLLRTKSALPLKDIGRRLGRRDHSTIIHSLASVQNVLGRNPDFEEKIESVLQTVHLGLTTS